MIKGLPETAPAKLRALSVLVVVHWHLISASLAAMSSAEVFEALGDVLVDVGDLAALVDVDVQPFEEPCGISTPYAFAASLPVSLRSGKSAFIDSANALLPCGRRQLDRRWP